MDCKVLEMLSGQIGSSTLTDPLSIRFQPAIPSCNECFISLKKYSGVLSLFLKTFPASRNPLSLSSFGKSGVWAWVWAKKLSSKLNQDERHTKTNNPRSLMSPPLFGRDGGDRNINEHLEHLHRPDFPESHNISPWFGLA